MASDERTASPLIEPSRLLEFAAFVRDSDLLVEKDARELAARFGLPEELVREALKVAQSNSVKAATERGQKRFSIRRAASKLADLLYTRPIVVSCAVGMVIGMVLHIVNYLPPFLDDALLVATVIIGTGLLIAINALRGQARYAVLTAFAAVGCGFASSTVIQILESRKFSFGDVVGLIAIVLFFTALGAMCLTLVAMIGAFVRIRKEASEEERLDRLLLLQRIFDLQERLSTARASDWTRGRWGWIEKLRERWHWISLVAGLGVGFVFALERVAFGIPASGRSIPADATLMVLNVLLVAIIIPTIGFVSGNFVRGLGSGALFATGKSAVDFLTRAGATLDEIAVSSIFLTLLGGIAGVAGHIEERAERSRRIAAADQTAILNEIIRLQKLLQTGVAEIYVMFIDVVKSTTMKAGRDPLKVEASFRAFHEFVGRTVRHHGGSVHSVSGDGAVVEFNSARDSLDAARALQNGIEQFNETSNRLDTRFRIRIGLHCGKVHGGLDQVVFTNVVDIAAHIEKFAPPGGVVVTDDFRERVSEGRFAQLDEKVEGHTLHLFLDVAG